MDASGLPFVNSQFSLDVKPITDAADDVILTLSSIPSGVDVTVNFKLEVSLKDYPLSTPVSLDVKLVYRECVTEKFEAPIIED